ncbi:hypothetical protein P9847_05405 [Paenibacillus chibensis]|uniref:SAM-dependent methyltransferase n=1 Tax=Paenibacillus chibensis TaxID=59846 RepID=A0ABU6PPD4_9BACL|nr:hypothetical protein [Paenibacillus chibensis]
MSEWKDLIEESKQRWEDNAYHWDDYMGDESNRFDWYDIPPVAIFCFKKCI